MMKPITLTIWGPENIAQVIDTLKAKGRVLDPPVQPPGHPGPHRAYDSLIDAPVFWRNSGARKRKAKVSVSYAQCEVFATMAMTCPLCGVTTTPRVWHRCLKPEGVKR